MNLQHYYPRLCAAFSAPVKVSVGPSTVVLIIIACCSSLCCLWLLGRGGALFSHLSCGIPELQRKGLVPFCICSVLWIVNPPTWHYEPTVRLACAGVGVRSWTLHFVRAWICLPASVSPPSGGASSPLRLCLSSQAFGIYVLDKVDQYVVPPGLKVGRKPPIKPRKKKQR